MALKLNIEPIIFIFVSVIVSVSRYVLLRVEKWEMQLSATAVEDKLERFLVYLRPTFQGNMI